MVTDSGHIQNGENNGMVNHGENTMIFYVPTRITSFAYTTHIHVFVYIIIVHKLTEKIIVVPFEYVLMLSRYQQQIRSERIESTRVNVCCVLYARKLSTRRRKHIHRNE